MVYLIHFDSPYPRDSRASVRHYLGYSASGRSGRGMIRRRLDHHANGRGSRFMRAVSLRGIGWRVVRTWWEGDRTLERNIKRSKNLPRYCPICNGKRSRLRADYWRWEPVTD